MEPLTQALLGAAVGQLAAPKLGRRALVWGALIGLSPDLDVVLGPLHDGYGELLYHRGFTHSLWFGPVVGPLMAWILWRWRDPERETALRDWVKLCIFALVTHPILDAFTPYGTQLFAPFWRYRAAVHGIGIIDPFYTALLAWGVLGARKAAQATSFTPAGMKRTAWAMGLSTAYLLASVGLNLYAHADVARLVPTAREINVYPTLLQPFLRRVVVHEPERLQIGWHTTLAPGCPLLQSTPRPPLTPQARELSATWQGEMMRWFALEDVVLFTTPLPEGGTLVEMEDLRYGFPGLEPARSMWGVRAWYDAAGRRIGTVERFRRSPGAARLDSFGALTLGRFAETGLPGEQPEGCLAAS